MFLSNRHPLWMRLVLILGAISLFVLAYQWGNQYQRGSAAPPVIGGLLIRPPASVPDVELREALGRPVGQKDLSQGWTLLAFGDLSRASGQLAVQRLIDVYNRVADERALRKQLRLVLVATGDDSSLSRDFAGLLPALKILGGDPEQIERFRAGMGLGLGGADTPSIFVVAPGGYLLAFLPETEGGAQMAEDLKAIHASSAFLLPETP